MVVDTTGWPKNVELLRTMEFAMGLRQQTDIPYPPFYWELFRADLLVPQPVEPQILADGTRSFLPFQEPVEGKNTIWAYTEAWSLSIDFPGGFWAVVVPARKLCQGARYNGIPQIALNFRRPVSFLLGSFEIEALAEGQIPVGPNQVESVVDIQARIDSSRRKP